MKISRSGLKKYGKRFGILFVVLFILSNSITALAFRKKTYPNTKIDNRAIGSVAHSKVAQKVSELRLERQEVTLKYKDQQATLSLRGAGITPDNDAVAKAITDTNHWLPIANFLTKHTSNLQYKIDKTKLDAAAKTLAPKFKKDPVDAKLSLDATFTIVAEQNGHNLDEAKLGANILKQLEDGAKHVTVPVNTTKPKVAGKELEAPQAALTKQLATEVTVSFDTKKKTTTQEERLSWFVPKDNGFELSVDAIKQYVRVAGSEFGITVGNASEIAAGVVQHMKDGTNKEFVLTKIDPVKIYAYCVQARGGAFDMNTFKTKITQTFEDARGWSLGGKNRFIEVASGCNFTVWLSAASEMPSFGSICDSSWSCRVGPNVVINADRWNGASDAWNAAGQSLEDYRSMVINHETGHWFGFGHSNCPGAGQLAPVMQQQSISLEGCTFNPWPLPSEQSSLERKLGV